ncbi:NAD(P)H-binding protein [Balneolaceae bacterium YR4-1]|uniref:NAD(P)H-binding protein n=1 Tax=Halalkalibaculum roseum TaxID=2709311 RepID=A0A6M1T4Y0_9BACT|nr:NAD(P)H-binding protein [Halalkalibaculum roseum]NGP75403.1 NAD(P)H-binding protein [Halalkalibaculum roseum]
MKISVLGCGWLGEPLAESLSKKDHTVKGSTTTESKIPKLEKKGIEAYLMTLEPDLNCENCESFWNADVLVLNIPPGRGRDNIIEYHGAQIQSVIEHLKSSDINRVVFVSSTSVYPKLPGVVEESDAIAGEAGRESGNALLRAESLLMDADEFNTTVLRFGGLYGYDRHPAKYMAGKTNLNRGKAPVNLIHRDDCIRIIEQIIEEEITGEIFNAVSDGHPPRKMYYSSAAEALDLVPPTFSEDTDKEYKVVSNRKLKDKLNYRFKYPNPMLLEQ